MNEIKLNSASQPAPITEIAAKLDLCDDQLQLYGQKIAKITPDFSSDQIPTDHKLILMTAVNPTPAGEGKTTMMIGLADAMNHLQAQTTVAMREPSMGPVFGRKGGATGGGASQVVPMEEINLHFTGDFHAITSANNLIAAMIDNELFNGNQLGIDPNSITFKRCLDMNDRTLRQLTAKNGEHVSFEITAASEIMAVLCLSTNLHDLKRRIGQITIGKNFQGSRVTVADLGVTDAAVILLKDAIMPNLVQTLAHTPAIIHGGPFANIAHGCNSVIATKAALMLSDYTVTEAGFGSDLGAEKFFDIKEPILQKNPDSVVVVATIRALKYNGGQQLSDLEHEDLTSLRQGLPNLLHHAHNIQEFGIQPLIALNRFTSDTDAELQLVQDFCREHQLKVAVADPFNQGGAGCLDLAKLVLQDTQHTKNLQPIYAPAASIAEKITTIVQKIYGGQAVVFSELAKQKLHEIATQGLAEMPVCIAKTPVSFSDNPKLLGNPTGFTITITDLVARTGAEFIVAYAGNILTLPGLPKHPAALNMKIDDQGNISGLS